MLERINTIPRGQSGFTESSGIDYSNVRHELFSFAWRSHCRVGKLDVKFLVGIAHIRKENSLASLETNVHLKAKRRAKFQKLKSLQFGLLG